MSHYSFFAHEIFGYRRRINVKLKRKYAFVCTDPTSFHAYNFLAICSVKRGKERYSCPFSALAAGTRQYTPWSRSINLFMMNSRRSVALSQWWRLIVSLISFSV